jgi:hypothetical protein
MTAYGKTTCRLAWDRSARKLVGWRVTGKSEFPLASNQNQRLRDLFGKRGTRNRVCKPKRNDGRPRINQVVLAGLIRSNLTQQTQSFAEVPRKGVLADCRATLRTVTSPTPRRWAMAVQDRPCALKRVASGRSTNTLGLPTCFSLALAFLSSALALSTMSDLSSSAPAPSTVNTIFPVGVVVYDLL